MQSLSMVIIYLNRCAEYNSYEILQLVTPLSNWCCLKDMQFEFQKLHTLFCMRLSGHICNLLLGGYVWELYGLLDAMMMYGITINLSIFSSFMKYFIMNYLDCTFVVIIKRASAAIVNPRLANNDQSYKNLHKCLILYSGINRETTVCYLLFKKIKTNYLSWY